MTLSWYSHASAPIWVPPEFNRRLTNQIVKEFKIHPVIAQVLVSRGIDSSDKIHSYLYSKLPDLYDPNLMAQMPQAVDRVCQAIANNETILIYGDNDVDGMTGTALLTEFLQFIGANAFFYLSNRGTQRQALIVEALEYAQENQCSLIITVDCGITAAKEIEQVVKHNIDVIITDHHVPTHTIPNCIATLNPKLVDNPYPNKDLTGVGVAFKLAHAITNRLVTEGTISPRKVDLKRYLDLVALGTISDMGALLGENRILVRYGIKQLARKKRIGLNKLIELTDPEFDASELTTFIIASKIAPRLNSLGRIDDPSKGVQMLLIRNTAAAEKLAIELDLNNLERQKIERAVANDVEATIEAHPELLNDKAIILSSDKWHSGVIAIISTRISKYYHRPTVIIAIENGLGKGSIRSIPEFPLLPALNSCSHYLINYGGHDYAAGLMIKPNQIKPFTQALIAVANKQLQHHDIMTKLRLDAEINFDEITFDFMESLRLLEPYGNENTQPIFYCNAKQAWPPKVIGRTTLKLYLMQGDRVLEGIAPGKAAYNPILRKRDLTLQVAFTPQITNFQGPSIQLMIRDFKILE